MTGYQKLKIENRILWSELEYTLKQYYSGTNNPEKNVKQFLEDLKWEIKRAQYEDKD